MVNCISLYHNRTIRKTNFNGTITDMDCVCTVSYHGGIGVAGMTDDIRKQNAKELKRAWNKFIKEQDRKNGRSNKNRKNH